MKFPFWLIPIFVVVVLLPFANKNQNKRWNNLNQKERKRIIAFFIFGIIALCVLTAIFFIANFTLKNN